MSIASKMCGLLVDNTTDSILTQVLDVCVSEMFLQSAAGISSCPTTAADYPSLRCQLLQVLLLLL